MAVDVGYLSIMLPRLPGPVGVCMSCSVGALLPSTRVGLCWLSMSLWEHGSGLWHDTKCF
jgi:hypothetical protein